MVTSLTATLETNAAWPESEEARKASFRSTEGKPRAEQEW